MLIDGDGLISRESGLLAIAHDCGTDLGQLLFHYINLPLPSAAFVCWIHPALLPRSQREGGSESASPGLRFHVVLDRCLW